jgi:peptidoglycan/LPS O-acetylase OafA/YrhL
LRALSVLAVIAFHLNGFVPGGYVGVDVFFVISGFLIGGIVFHEIDSGTFSFVNFYKRRVRRIAPALILTLLGLMRLLLS